MFSEELKGCNQRQRGHGQVSKAGMGGSAKYKCSTEAGHNSRPCRNMWLLCVFNFEVVHDAWHPSESGKAVGSTEHISHFILLLQS